MNKTKIEWADYTWNPVTGCLHGCEYCYARRIAERFGAHLVPISGKQIVDLDEPDHMVMGRQIIRPMPYPFDFLPTFHRYKLDEPLRKTSGVTIFVCSMADLFGDWVPDEWIKEVFAACLSAPQHTYLFLTKNPRRYAELACSGILTDAENMWYGATMTQPGPPLFNGLHPKYHTFISIEPILGPVCPASGVDWVIVGAMTGPNAKKYAPTAQRIDSLAWQCEKGMIPIFMKDSLLKTISEDKILRQFPEGIKLSTK